jgi:FG-GAP-like repeat/IPT/TIG domain
MRKTILLPSLLILLITSIQSVFGQVPTISGFSPATGPVGQLVTITGTGFHIVPANNTVYFGAVKAQVTGSTTTSINVLAPAGATYQPISVMVGGLTAFSAKPFVQTFSGPGGIDLTSFAAKQDLVSTNGGNDIKLGDLDGDGKSDLTIADYNTGNPVSIFRNISTSGSLTVGSFAARFDLTGGASPYSVAVSDLDGDGKLDLAVANRFTSNSVSVFRNISTTGALSLTSFAAKADFPVGTNPGAITTADIDGDGKLDLIVVNNGSNTLSVFRNISTVGSLTTSSFAARLDFTTASGPSWVSAGDLDGDGKVDLAISNMSSNTVSVFRNTSTVGTLNISSFAAKVDFTTGTAPISVTIGDMDVDGKADLVIANNTNTSVSVLRNLSTVGTTLFAGKIDFLANSAPSFASIGDLDGDGKPEMAVTNLSGSNVSIYRNTATAGAITATSFAVKVDFTTGLQPNSVAIGDLDGDGRADLSVANLEATVSIFRNQITMFTTPIITQVSPQSGAVGTSVTITGAFFSATPANNLVYFGSTKANVTAATLTQLTVTVPAGATYQPITVTTNGLTAFSPKPFLITFPGSGVINSTSFAPNVDFAAGSGPYTVLIGDLDGDGKSDLTSINRTASTISLYRNTIVSPGTITAASFAAKVDLATGTGPYSGAVGDLNGDGKPEIVVSNFDDGTFSIFKNISTSGTLTTGSFAARVNIATGTDPYGVAIQDLDADGKPDIVIVNNSDASISVFKNQVSSGVISSSSFAVKVDFTVGTDPYNVAIADLDKDGKPDLVVSNYTDNTVSVLRNTSATGFISPGSFAAKVDYATGNNPGGLLLADLDLDGVPEIATSNSLDNTISILENKIISPGAFTSTSFGTKVDFLGGQSAVSIGAGDLDGDGRVDLANDGNKATAILKNSIFTGIIGSGALSPKIEFATGSSYPYSTAIGDLDGDGKPEIVEAIKQSDLISVVRNTTAVGQIKPTTKPYIIGFYFVSSTSVTPAWLGPDPQPSGFLVVRKVGSASTTGIPVDGTAYVANQTLGDATVAFVGPANAFVDSGLAPGTVYFYTVYPYNGGGTSIAYLTTTPLVGNQRLPASGSLIDEPLGQPFNLVFSGLTSGGYTLTYSAPTAVPDGYLIVVNSGAFATGSPLDGVTYANGSTLSNGSGTAYTTTTLLSATVTGLSPGTANYYTIYSFKGSGTSINYLTISPLMGNITTLTGTLASAPTFQPTGLNFFGVTTSSYTVSYTAASGAPAGYIAIRRAGLAPGVNAIPQSGTTYATGSTISSGTVAYVGSALSFAESGLTPGITYFYNIYSYNGAGTSINYFLTNPLSGNIPLTYLTPAITGFAPSHGGIGATVTIFGTNFTTDGTAVVEFNGVTATIVKTSPTSFTVTVPATAPSGQITLTQGTQVATSVDSFTVDVPPLTITAHNFISSYLKDGTSAVSITVNDATAVGSVNLWTKGITVANDVYTSRAITSTNATFTATLSSSETADAIGLMYYFEAIDLGSNSISSILDSAYLSLPKGSVDGVIPSLTFGTSSASYQIVAVPFVLGDKSLSSAFSAFGTYDKTKWRFFSYGGSQYTELSPSASVDVGKGYWLIAKTTTSVNVTSSSAGSTVNVSESNPYTITLSPGWNLIGNPYNFPVSWQDILDENGITGSSLKLRVFKSGDLTDGTILERFRGAFVNNSGASTTLKIPVIRDLSLGGRIAPIEPTPNGLDKSDWNVNLILSTAEGSNHLGAIGMHPNATLKGEDKFDEESLPVPEGFGLNEVVFSHPEIGKTFDKEFVPTAGVYTWEFEIKKGSADGVVTLSWRNDYFGAGDNQIILFDPATMESIDMRKIDHYVLDPKTRKMQILFGNRDYVDTALDKELPLVSRAYPNPGQHRVVIPFRVPLTVEQANVNLTVFDGQGNTVTTLVNGEYPKGNYEAVWLPEVSAGLYYVQFKLDTHITESQKIVIIK